MMSNIKFIITLAALSALLAGEAMTSVQSINDISGKASKAPLELVPTEPPLLPTNLDRNIRALIFDFVAHSDSTNNNFFNHENLRILEMVNIATAMQVRDYRKLRNVLPRLVLSIPTLSELLEMFRLNNAPDQNNGERAIQWQIRSEDPMGGQEYAELGIKHDEFKAGKSDITFRNLCISQLTENSIALSCELLYERDSYSYRHRRNEKKTSFIRLNRDVQLPYNANLDFSSFVPKPLEPNSIFGHLVSYSESINYKGANKEDLIFKLDLNAGNGVLGAVPHTYPFVSTKPNNAIYLSPEDSSIVISAPGLQTLMQMLKSEYTNSAQSNLVSPEGWKITCGRYCDMNLGPSGKPYNLFTKLWHLREGFSPRLLSVSLVQLNDQAIMSCRYIYERRSPYSYGRANSESYGIVYRQQVTLPEHCVIAFQPLRPLEVTPQSRCDTSITFGMDRTDQALEDGFTFACGYRIAVPEDIDQ